MKTIKTKTMKTSETLKTSKIMKTLNTIKLFTLLAVFAFAFTSCSDDDDAPLPVNEEEVITTMTVTLAEVGGTTTETISVTDDDGDGPNQPVISPATLELDANTEYAGSIEFLNELETPVEDITAEVAEEDEEHQVFYVPSSSVNITVAYNDQDANGNPLGLDFTLTTGDASGGTLTVTLIHEPIKDAAGVSDGDPTNAGGETDIQESFPVSIQ
jgi:hypothetical protein